MKKLLALTGLVVFLAIGTLNAAPLDFSSVRPGGTNDYGSGTGSYDAFDNHIYFEFPPAEINLDVDEPGETVVPEPTTITLLTLGGLVLGFLDKKRRSRRISAK
jgi:hypothetical protein